jgi:hypothetical protein
VIKTLALLTCCYLVFAAPVGAQEKVYTYVDEDGTIHFTDMPRDGVVELNLAGGKKDNRQRIVGDEVPYHELINAAAQRHGLDAGLVAAVAQVESAFDNRAVSKAGAKGIMQLMDETALVYGVTDVFNPAQNIDAGAHHLADLMHAYNGDLKLTLAAYNAGRGAVQRHGGVPPYQETKRYIEKISAVYSRVDGEISESQIDNSYAAARAIARGEGVIYRYQGPNGLVYSDMPPGDGPYEKISLREAS